MGEDLVCPGWELTMWLLVLMECRVCVVGKREQGKHPLRLLGSSCSCWSCSLGSSNFYGHWWTSAFSPVLNYQLICIVGFSSATVCALRELPGRPRGSGSASQARGSLVLGTVQPRAMCQSSRGGLLGCQGSDSGALEGSLHGRSEVLAGTFHVCS